MRTQYQILSCLTIIILSLNCSNSQESKEGKYYYERKSMVEYQIKNRGINNKKVLEALMQVPRHKFVPDEYKNRAYDDTPLPIGFNQTISQPYIVAFMTQILKPDSSEKVLEIGTGSGYQAAILSMLYKEVYTIEIVDTLGKRARKVLEDEKYNNVKVRIGDGYQGWKEYAPYDAVIVTCAPTDIPPALVEQLAEGGKMVIPVGGNYNQTLYLLEKKNGKIRKTETLPVIFVPMVKGNKDKN